MVVGKPDRKGHFEDPGVDGRRELNSILKKKSRREWSGFIYEF
jgi:hypothetical protein